MELKKEGKVYRKQNKIKIGWNVHHAATVVMILYTFHAEINLNCIARGI